MTDVEKLDEETIKQIKDLMKRGFAYSQIAEKLGITKQQIHNYVPVDKRSLRRISLR